MIRRKSHCTFFTIGFDESDADDACGSGSKGASLLDLLAQK
jgi:hypothetical protein